MRFYLCNTVVEYSAKVIMNFKETVDCTYSKKNVNISVVNGIHEKTDCWGLADGSTTVYLRRSAPIPIPGVPWYGLQKVSDDDLPWKRVYSLPGQIQETDSSPSSEASQENEGISSGDSSQASSVSTKKKRGYLCTIQ